MAVKFASLLSFLIVITLFNQAWAEDGYWLPDSLTQADAEIVRYLQQQQRGDEIIELGNDDSEFPGFYLPQRTRSPQGAVLILPDNGEHGQWPVIAGPLRESLPDSGWSTLAINLPNTPNDNIPDELKESYQQQMLQRISAAISYLQNRGQLNLAIAAHGRSAAWASAWLKENNLAKNGIGLIMIDARNDSYAPQTLLEALPQLRLPMLDVITYNNKQSEMSNSKRKGALLSSKIENYQQVADDEAIRRIRGWLKKNMAGEERKVKPSAPTGANN